MTSLNVPQRIIELLNTMESELTAREVCDLLNQDGPLLPLNHVRSELSRLNKAGRLIRNDRINPMGGKTLAHYSLPSTKVPEKPVISTAPDDVVHRAEIPSQFSDNQPLRTAQALLDKKTNQRIDEIRHNDMMMSNTGTALAYQQGYEYGREQQASQIKDAPTPVASAEGATANASEQANEAKPKKVLVTDNYRMGYADGFNDGFQKAIELAKLGLI